MKTDLFRVMAHTSTLTRSITRVNGTRITAVAGAACTTQMALSMRESGTTMNAVEWDCTD